MLTNGEDIAIGYGTKGSFPHAPDTYLLKQVMAGKSALQCSAGPAKQQKSCLAPTRTPKATAPSTNADPSPNEAAARFHPTLGIRGGPATRVIGKETCHQPQTSGVMDQTPLGLPRHTG